MTAAVVLAAGGSSRMGRPKQLLPFRGRTLLRHAAEVAVAAGGDPVVVVLGAAADRLRGELDGLPVTAVTNPDWQQGPGTSVRAGVAALPDGVTAVVVLLADQPFVTADDLRALIAARLASGLPMAASAYGGAVGVPAVFARACFPDLLALDPAAGAKKLLSRHPDRVAVVPLAAGALDLDTPADYERWAETPDSDAEVWHGHGQ